MVLWANLHGGFVLGLALIAPVALVAVWDAAPDRRVSLILRWGFFAVCALAASCCTPYGWNALLGAARILDLGQLLSIISEWQPADFSSFGFFEASPARPGRPGILPRPCSVPSADYSAAGFDPHGTDACQKHRGVRVSVAAGFGEAARRPARTEQRQQSLAPQGPGRRPTSRSSQQSPSSAQPGRRRCPICHITNSSS